MNTNVFGHPNLIEMKVVLSHLECVVFLSPGYKAFIQTRPTTKIIHYVGLVGPKATAFIIIPSKQALHPGLCEPTQN